MILADLPPLRESLAAHGLMAKKSFGQHFLLDLNITAKIARLAGHLEGAAVLEVGPGPGGLTRALLQAGARVVAVEKDRRFIPLLQQLEEAAAGALQVIEADALEIDEVALLEAHAPAAPRYVVANLPYNVSVPLLVKWLKSASAFQGMALMFQQEVAERIAAMAGSAAYGRLSVLAQAIAEAEVVMALPARAFTPPPKIESAVVRLTPRQEGLSASLIERLERVTQAAFGQRRKMLRSSLKPLGGETLCRSAGLDPSLRAEAVPVQGFLELARRLDG